MGAKKRCSRKQRGQSLIEFAFLLPIIMTMLIIMVGVENAVTSAIVNNKYARSQLHYLLFNSRYYPEVQFATPSQGDTLFGRWWVGVDQKVRSDENRDVNPSAPTIKIGKGRPPAGDETAGDTETRQNVRIRIYSFICIPAYGLKSSQFFSEGNIVEGQFAVGKYRFCAN